MSATVGVNPSRSVVPVAVAVGLFVLAVVGAWAWFNINPREYPNHWRIATRPNVPGYYYTNIIMAPAVLDELSVSTNELVNGTFKHSGGSDRDSAERVTVFFATWEARSAREMSVVQHTPDICWVGSGAVPVALGQPPTVMLRFNGTDVPFECRVFTFADGSREMSLWCTLVSGQVYLETVRFSPAISDSGPVRSASDPVADMYAAGRRASGGQFLNSIGRRIRGTGEKQFVRFSTGLAGGDWAGALNQLRTFAHGWLLLTDTKAGNSGTPSP